MKEAIIIFLAALLIGAAVNGIMGSGSAGTANPSPQEQAGQSNSSATADTSAVAETGDASFNADVLQSATPVLVDFSADWCEPCKQMAPIVAKLAADYKGKVKVLRVDTDKSPNATADNKVQGIPTFIIFKNGKVFDSYTGVVPEGVLKTVLDKALG